MAVGLKLTNEHNKKQVSRFFNIMRSKGCILSVVLLLISVTLFTITNKDKAYADIKCYSSDELTPGECVSSIISVGKTVSARDGSTFTIQDNKCYAYGDLSAGDLSIKEIVCPTREVSDEPTCYTGVGITIDCSDVPEELAGEEWRKPSFENGKCYREVSMDEWLRAAGIEDFPSNKIIGTVWTEASCSDLGATLEEKDCISDSLCNDVITKAKEEAAAATSDETPAKPEDTEINCEKSLTGPGWLICSVIEYSIDGIEALEEVIQGQLRFDLDNISGSATGGGEAEIRRGNGSITVVANTAFAIGILWIVLSQAISGGAGGGFFGAYEAKKILPKLIAGVIVANFSWDLANLMLKISNSLGDATKSIMLTPFGGNITIDIDNVDSWALLLGGVGTGLAVFFGFFALTPILLAAALAILIGYFALVFRKAVIIALVTFAPIALVISPFAPNITKRWMNMLRNMIFMYPIIMGMISAFAIMAHLLNIQAKATTGIPGMALRLAAIASLFAPYFMIVTLFKLMGDILGKLTGSVSALNSNHRKKWSDERKRDNWNNIRKAGKNKSKTDVAAQYATARYAQGPKNRIGKTRASAERLLIGGPGKRNRQMSDAIHSQHATNTELSQVAAAKIRMERDNAAAGNASLRNEASEHLKKTAEKARKQQDRRRPADPALTASRRASMKVLDENSDFGTYQAMIENGNITESEVNWHNSTGGGFASMDPKAPHIARATYIGDPSDSGSRRVNTLQQVKDVVAKKPTDSAGFRDQTWEFLAEGATIEDPTTGSRRLMTDVEAFNHHNSHDQAGAAAREAELTLAYPDPKDIAKINEEMNKSGYVSSHMASETMNSAQTFIDSMAESRDNNSEVWQGVASSGRGLIDSIKPPPSSTPIPSDLRLKKDVVKIGKFDDLNVYAFRYINDSESPEYIGLMAQDLLKNKKYRKYVVKMDNGFYAIDYEGVGFEFKKIKL